MRGENPEKITYSQVWDYVFEDYEPKGNRLNRIFNSDSDYNTRLSLYSDLCGKFEPDIDNELKMLGFSTKKTVYYPDFVTPEYKQFYFNGKGDVISISEAGIMVVTFNDQKKSFECDIIGENERMALRWIKEINEAESEKN